MNNKKFVDDEFLDQALKELQIMTGLTDKEIEKFNAEYKQPNFKEVAKAQHYIEARAVDRGMTLTDYIRDRDLLEKDCGEYIKELNLDETSKEYFEHSLISARSNGYFAIASGL